MPIERRLWKCPSCGRKYNIPTSADDPKLCPKCRKETLQEPEKTRPRLATRSRTMLASKIAVIVIVCFFVGLIASRLTNDSNRGASSPQVHNRQIMQAPVDMEPAHKTREELIRSVEPAVVTIEVRGDETISQGTGFVVDLNGTIVTNYHVIQGAKEVFVIFADGRRIPATGFLHFASGKDLALLRIATEQGNLKALRLAEAITQKGQTVLAFGSPIGLTGTVSEGIVSSIRNGDELRRILSREAGYDVYGSELGYHRDVTWVQTTAAINPGNSGGPLVNSQGEVVGVNTFSPPKSDNLNFAVSSLHVRHLLRLSANHTPLSFALLPESTHKGITPPTGSTGRSPRNVDDKFQVQAAWDEIRDGRYTEALLTLSKIPPETRGSGYWSARAHLYMMLNDYREAMKSYAEVIHIDNSDVNSWIGFASAMRLAKVDDWSSIQRACRTALQLNPADARAYNILGLTTVKDTEAIKHFQTAIKLDENHLGAHFNLGVAYLMANQNSNAIKHFQKVMDLLKDAQNYLIVSEDDTSLSTYSSKDSLKTFMLLQLAAVHCGSQTEGQKTINLCEQVLREEPNNGAVYWLMGMEYRGRGSRSSDHRLIQYGEKLQEQGRGLGVDGLDITALSAGTTGIMIFRK